VHEEISSTLTPKRNDPAAALLAAPDFFLIKQEKALL
jgi:hypothetical protein